VPSTSALAALALLLLPAQEKIEMRWRFQKGGEFRYRMLQRLSLGDSFRLEFKDTLRFSVRELGAGGVATLDITFEKVAIASKGIQSWSFDSDREEPASDHPLARMVARLQGQSFVAGFLTTGEVRDVTGMEAVLEHLVRGAQGEQEAILAKQQLGRMISNDTMRARLQQMSPGLPRERVGKGDGWTSSFPLKLPVIGAVKLEGASTLDELGGGTARTEQELKVLMPGADDPENPLAGLFEIKDGTGRSSGRWSVADGRFETLEFLLQGGVVTPAQMMKLALEFRMERIDAR
jgi:hypothetical protein